jgi:hypothetical protein
MSIEVQKIIEAVRALTPEERDELFGVLQGAQAIRADADRAEAVRSIRGSYAHVQTSSQAFAHRKISELELEESGRG